MRIVLIGYGKMGKEIEKAAHEKGYEVVLIISASNAADISLLKSSKADVAIEFTTPQTAVHNITACFKAGIPVVVGTTGWYEHLPDLKLKCEHEGHTMIYASNFSIGVNILFELNRVLAKIMNHQPDYNVAIEEIHHTRKLDSPSGTAITLANDIISRVDRKTAWIETDSQDPGRPGDLTIHSKRLDDVVGTHIIKYVSKIDKLELSHEAASREGFVQGALKAAEWIAGKKGCYNMQDLLHME